MIAAYKSQIGLFLKKKLMQLVRDFLNLLFCVIFERDFLILIELRFLSEIILILFIVVPSARLELALRKRQGF